MSEVHWSDPDFLEWERGCVGDEPHSWDHRILPLMIHRYGQRGPGPMLTFKEDVGYSCIPMVVVYGREGWNHG